jgi:hypothetical protein
LPGWRSGLALAGVAAGELGEALRGMTSLVAAMTVRGDWPRVRGTGGRRGAGAGDEAGGAARDPGLGAAWFDRTKILEDPGSAECFGYYDPLNSP